MKTELGRITILVKDCDEAYDFYEKNLGCKKFFDLVDSHGKRYLHVGFDTDLAAGIWLSEAETEEEFTRIGDQTGGKPAFVVYTDSFDEFHERLISNGTEIIEEPAVSHGHKSVHFRDLYGNIIVAVDKVKSE